MSRSIYRQLGTRPVINARGIYTDLGGSVLTPTVWSAMTQANQDFVYLPELLDTTGEVIAQLMGAEAARVTPGASAAIVLACGACMTGTDGARMEQLPDTTGLKNEVVIQVLHRYKYDRMVRMSGARLTEAGSRESGTTVGDLQAAMGPATAAVFFPAHLDGAPGTLGLRTVVEIAHDHSVPVLVDAAYLNYPVDLMRSFHRAGADLVFFSAKYYGGPNSGGFACGRRSLIEAIAGIDFTRFESGDHLVLGRPFKLDRQVIVGTVLALREWIECDHAERFRRYARHVDTIASHLDETSAVEAAPMSFTMEEDLIPEPVNCLVVRVGSPGRALKIDAGLRSGDPAIFAHVRGDALIVDVEVIGEGQAEIIGTRLREEIIRASDGDPELSPR
jgi:L-seryl-tRNA(Ser) seleniumtransferase